VRIGIYTRVSTHEQSTELQLREIRQYVVSRAWTEITIYEELGKSGTNANRQKLKELMRDARERKLDVVICWKLDRLFRSLKDLVTALNEFTELGVDFISLRDNIDMTTSAGRLMTHMLGAFAEFEASLIRERVCAGIANAKANGKTLGRPKKRNDKKIRLLRNEGLSLREISQRLGTSKSAVQCSLRPTVPKTPVFTGVISQ